MTSKNAKYGSTPNLAKSAVNIYEPTMLSSKREKFVILDTPGEGSVSFNFEKHDPSTNPACSVFLKKKSLRPEAILKLTVFNSKITLTGEDAWRFQCVEVRKLSKMCLLYFRAPWRCFWVSVDKNRACIKVGHGYMLASNTLVRFEPKNKVEREYVQGVLEKVERIQLGDTWSIVSPLKYWRLPVVKDPPHVIVSRKSASLAGFEEKKFTTAQWFPMEALRLYSSVKRAKIELSEDQVKWINHSIATKGCALHENLQQTKTSCVRVGLENDSVLELWPVGLESPIHSHGGAVGIIKVLHGSIEMSYYNPLANEYNEDQSPFKTVILNEGDVTWMTSEFYQTHKLRNTSEDTMAVTIQCYSNGDDEHFDYLSETDRKLHQFRPRNDFIYQDMLNLVEGEYMRQTAGKKKFFRMLHREA